MRLRGAEVILKLYYYHVVRATAFWRLLGRLSIPSVLKFMTSNRGDEVF
jgi:hypothetical protein